MKKLIFLVMFLGLAWFSFGCGEDKPTDEFITVVIIKVYEERRVGDRDHTTIVSSLSRHRYMLKGILGTVGDTLVVKKQYLK